MSDRSRITRTVTLWLALCAVGGVAPAQELADPTRPADYRKSAPAPSAPALPALKLTSIMISPERRIAIIDGRLLRPGSVHKGLRVVSIERDRVRLEGAAGSVTLQLLPTAVKRAVRKVKQ
ncbi:MAG: hypothetical protein Kow006_13730 [Gammaproteobacteria bacterium]